MDTIKVFVDGQEGTTGLKIFERLALRADIQVLSIDPALRKDAAERRKLLSQADIAFLCLPDDAAREAVTLAEGSAVRIIDSSTAHRIHPDWVYGMPELEAGQRERIRQAKRVTVPGCHATAFALGLAPLVQAGVVPADYPVVAYSLTGYSGAGKKMIAIYEAPDADLAYLNGPRHYALGLTHKHLPEMQQHVGLAAKPVFMPVIANFAQGMVVTVPLLPQLLTRKLGPRDVHALLAERYRNEPAVRVMPFDDPAALEDGFLGPQACNDTNRADVFVLGNADQILLAVRLDNLGKGASGAAMQCMNIMCGKPELEGLLV